MTTERKERLGPLYKKGRGLYESEVDLTRCRRNVHEPGRGFHIYQCSRKGKHEWVDPETNETYKFCKTHHPGEVAKRDRAREQKWADEAEARKQGREKSAITRGLPAASDEQLLAECEKRGWTVSK